MAPAPRASDAWEAADGAAAEREAEAARARSAAYAGSARRALDQGRLVEAADFLHSAAAWRPGDREILEAMGETYLRLGRFLEAVPPLQGAMHLGGGADGRLSWLLACALAGAGDESGARAVLDAAGMPAPLARAELHGFRRLRSARNDQQELLARALRVRP